MRARVGSQRESHALFFRKKIGEFFEFQNPSILTWPLPPVFDAKPWVRPPRVCPGVVPGPWGATIVCAVHHDRLVYGRLGEKAFVCWHRCRRGTQCHRLGHGVHAVLPQASSYATACDWNIYRRGGPGWEFRELLDTMVVQCTYAQESFESSCSIRTLTYS